MLFLFGLLDRLLSTYMFCVLMRVAWAWTEHYPHNPLVRKAYRPPFVHVLRFLFAVVDPVVRPLRRYIPMGRGGMFLDLGPLILLLILMLTQTILRRLMWEFLVR